MNENGIVDSSRQARGDYAKVKRTYTPALVDLMERMIDVV
jgi:hypothetical protein